MENKTNDMPAGDASADFDFGQSPFGRLLNLPGIDGPQDIFGGLGASDGDNPFGGDASGDGNPFAGGGNPFADSGQGGGNLFGGDINPFGGNDRTDRGDRSDANDDYIYDFGAFDGDDRDGDYVYDFAAFDDNGGDDQSPDVDVPGDIPDDAPDMPDGSTDMTDGPLDAPDGLPDISTAMVGQPAPEDGMVAITEAEGADDARDDREYDFSAFDQENVIFAEAGDTVTVEGGNNSFVVEVRGRPEDGQNTSVIVEGGNNQFVIIFDYGADADSGSVALEDEPQGSDSGSGGVGATMPFGSAMPDDPDYVGGDAYTGANSSFDIA